MNSDMVYGLAGEFNREDVKKAIELAHSKEKKSMSR